MQLTETQLKVIELLAECEIMIGRLYKEYAQKFLDWKDFWSRLSAEEREHANWILKLRSKIKEGSVYFEDDRFNKEAIKTSLKYLNNKLSEAQMQNISLTKALSTARDIENGLIEKKFFEVFEGDPVKLKHVLLNLATSTKEHYNRIEKAWKEAKQLV